MLKEYIKQFGLGIADFIQIGDRFFIVPENFELKEWIVYAGRYLGMNYNNKFIPSIDLLFMIAERTEQWITVNQKTEWLVICGRDVFSKSILAKGKEFRKKDTVIVLNEKREPIGVGRIADDEGNIKMQYDIGSLIRRTKKKK